MKRRLLLAAILILYPILFYASAVVAETVHNRPKALGAELVLRVDHRFTAPPRVRYVEAQPAAFTEFFGVLPHCTDLPSQEESQGSHHNSV